MDRETEEYFRKMQYLQPYRDRYVKGVEKIQEQWSVLYNLKAWNSPMADSFEELCRQHIQIANEMIAAEKSVGEDFNIADMPGYTRLSMLYERQERYSKGISVCVVAIKNGYTKGMYARLARLIRKSGIYNPEAVKLLAHNENG